MLTDTQRLYAATVREMIETAVPEAAQPSEEFWVQKRRKQILSDGQAQALELRRAAARHNNRQHRKLRRGSFMLRRGIE
jgi:hypothetical protein